MKAAWASCIAPRMPCSGGRPRSNLLLPDRAGAEALTRFEREVRRTAMLTHPNTVTVFDYGQTTEGVFYYAMELLEGASLQEIVEVDGPQPAERVIHLLEQVAGSLAEAHDAGLIHRDIKPGNILVVDRGGIADLVKVVDFGLVKDVRGGGAAEATITTADAITGTPHYMAPETISAPDTVDARTDIYALGAVGYWLLTGTHVFRGNTVMEVLAHHLHSAPEKPSARLGVAVERDLEKVLLGCLAKRPEDRPASAHVLRDQLRACYAARRWTNQRASEWWTSHRHQLRSANPATKAGRRGSVAADGYAHSRLTRTCEQSGSMIDRLVSDVVSALRSLRAAPAIPMAAVLTTSLAVAMNLAMAGLIDRALLSPPEFVVDPQQVFTVGFEVTSPSGEKGVTSTASYLTFEAVRDRVTSVTAAAWHPSSTSIGVGDSRVPVKANGVTGAYFNMLGARAALGRTLLPDDDRPPVGAPVAVLSHSLWRRAFGADPQAVGQQLRFGGLSLQIVGVMPPGFSGHTAERVDLWLPLSTAMHDSPGWTGRPNLRRRTRCAHRQWRKRQRSVESVGRRDRYDGHPGAAHRGGLCARLVPDRDVAHRGIAGGARRRPRQRSDVVPRSRCPPPAREQYQGRDGRDARPPGPSAARRVGDRRDRRDGRRTAPWILVRLARPTRAVSDVGRARRRECRCDRGGPYWWSVHACCRRRRWCT